MATILIVDDLRANREFLATILRAQGHRLLDAANGREALAAVAAEHPDLVITDVLMPVMDGYEFVRQLRLDPTAGATPVLFYTAPYGAREARTLARSCGVPGVLTKPPEPDEVLRIVGRVLSGEPEARTSPDAAPLAPAVDREHLRLLTDELSEKADDLRISNARLRALINIGLELACERDSDRLLQHVCVAVRDLFAATSVTLGILNPHDGTTQRVVADGADEGTTSIGNDEATSTIVARVVAERCTMRGDHPGRGSTGPQDPALRPDAQAFLAAPVASPANVYGWIYLVGHEDRTFTENDEHLVMALSGLVGRIYENSRFSAVAQQRADELEREILDRKQAESALRQEGDRAQRYLNTAEVMLMALDTAGLITLANRYACSVLGWTADELLGRDFVDTCLPLRIRNEWRQKLPALVSGDLPSGENPVLTKSGEERLVEWCNIQLRDDEGRVTGTLSSGTDVTERNQALEALRVAEERMRFALQGADVGIWDMDCVTGVLRWSEILEAQYGLSPGTFSGTFEAFIERVHPGDRATVAGDVGGRHEIRRGFLRAEPIPLAGRHGAVAARRGPFPPGRARRTAARRRHLPGLHRAPRPRGAVSECPGDGGRRTSGRRRGARLQQPPHRDSRILRAVAGRHRPGRSAQGGHQGNSEGGHERRGAHAPAPGVQPQADHRADAARPECGHGRNARGARTTDRGGRDDRAGAGGRAGARESRPRAGGARSS